jgi:hypothetical protein
MKKLIIRPEDVVRDGLEGISAAHSDRVRVSFGSPYLARIDAPGATSSYLLIKSAAGVLGTDTSRVGPAQV